LRGEIFFIIIIILVVVDFWCWFWSNFWVQYLFIYLFIFTLFCIGFDMCCFNFCVQEFNNMRFLNVRIFIYYCYHVCKVCGIVCFGIFIWKTSMKKTMLVLKYERFALIECC
jgi:hypothetical protein